MKKNILQIVQHLKPGGIETMALDLQQNLENCHVHIVSLEGTKKEALKDWPRLVEREENLHFLNKRPGLSLAALLKLIRLIQRLKIDAIHTHHIGPLTYGGTAARLCGVKNLVHTEHDAWHLEHPKAAKLEKKLLRYLKPDLVADCSYVAERLIKLSNHVKPRVIYNGIDTQKFSPATSTEKRQARQFFNMPEDGKIIGCAARLEKVKGISFLIAAMSFMPQDTYLVLAGEGKFMARLQRQAKYNKANKRIIFLGRVEKMANFYKAIDLFCLPSLNEGFPLSPLEAQACNIPTIITDVGGAKETLCPNSGHLVPPQDTYALKFALNNALKNTLDTIAISAVTQPRHFVKGKADLRLMATAYAALLTVME